MDDLDVRNVGWRVLRVLGSIVLGVGAAVGIAVALPNDRFYGDRDSSVNPFAVFVGIIGIAIGCYTALGAIAARLGRTRRLRTLIPIARLITRPRTHRA
jgi:hypothetical protein